MRKNWDIFCRVVDNYGDIGVCWRLARQLAAEHEQNVRLWVDDLASLVPLCPEVDAGSAQQTLAGVDLRHWASDFPAIAPADVVIEAFACTLPATYERAMTDAVVPPLWINLEYLSAEAWIEGCHGLASPHPTLPLVKYFWFPGFSAASGGLLRESGLLAERDHFRATQPASEALQISLFCYETAPVAALLDAWAHGGRPVHCRVPPGKPLAAVSAHLGAADANGRWQRGALLVEAIPFLPQESFDQLLWRSDLNFVRGEDSFVRAQWAGVPLIWQIYRQAEDAHLDKLNAFLDLYCAALPPAAANALRQFHQRWNSPATLRLDEDWQALLTHLPALREHAAAWCRALATGNTGQDTELFANSAQPAPTANADDLATGLVKFAAAKL